MENLNAASAAFAALAAVVAAFIGGLSIYELRRIDARARRREATQYDDALQSRLDVILDDLREVMGTPDDGIPAALRKTLMRFFVLYSDAFAADRDGLLGSSDNAPMLDEFDFWAQQPAGRSAWEVFAAYSWPQGFAEHVDHVFLEQPPYQVQMLPARQRWPVVVLPAVGSEWTPAKDPEKSDVLPSPSKETRLPQPLQCAEVLLRVRHREPEFPPSRLDNDLKNTDVVDRQRERRAVFANWLMQSGAIQRWVAVMGSRAVGYVEVGSPATYLDAFLTQRPELGVTPTQALEMRHLFIDPDLRGAGSGRLLVEAAQAYVRNEGKTPILVVLPESRAAIRLYSALGWHEIGSFTGTQGTNLVMTHEAH